MPALRVVVADDSVLIRAGVTRVLAEEGFEIVAELGDAMGLMPVIEQLLPDVVVIDIRMPPTRTDEGVQAAREIRRLHPRVGVVVLSAFAEPDYVLALLSAGSDGLGYLLKERIGDIEDFAAAVRRVAHGGSALDPAVVELMVADSARRSVAARSTNAGRPTLARVDMDALMLEHAIAWARDHRCGVAREVRDGFVAVTPDGRHTRHAHFYQALEWLDSHGAAGDR
jgi:DNA-binding NarL/FixJ family response regulator